MDFVSQGQNQDVTTEEVGWTVKTAQNCDDQTILDT
jgi:hypothetical protein